MGACSFDLSWTGLLAPSDFRQSVFKDTVGSPVFPNRGSLQLPSVCYYAHPYSLQSLVSAHLNHAVWLCNFTDGGALCLRPYTSDFSARSPLDQASGPSNSKRGQLPAAFTNHSDAPIFPSKWANRETGEHGNPTLRGDCVS